MISILITLVIVGGCLAAVSVIPMPDWVKKLINIVVAIYVCLWLLDAFGIYSTHIHLR